MTPTPTPTPTRAPTASTVLTMDDRWPLAADWPCCTPHCSVWTEPDGTTEWAPVHNANCPTRQT